MQELVTAKLLLDKGNNGGNNNELIRLLVASGDKKFEGLLEGIELAKNPGPREEAEAKPSSWIEKLGSIVAQYLERKSVRSLDRKALTPGYNRHSNQTNPDPGMRGLRTSAISKTTA